MKHRTGIGGPLVIDWAGCWLVPRAATVIQTVILAMGCGLPSQEIPVGSMRFIKENPQEQFTAQSIADSVTIFEWEPTSDILRDDWVVGGDGVLARTPKGRFLVRIQHGGTATITGMFEGDSKNVDAVELELEGLHPRDVVRLLWAREGQEFDNRRSIKQSARLGRGVFRREFRFPVGRDPDWGTAVKQLRFSVKVEGARDISLWRIAAEQLIVDPEQLNEALGRGWKIDLAGVHRSVLLGLPGHPFERPLKVAPDSDLRFACGLPGTQVVPVTFRVLVLAEGKQGQAGGTTVFEEVFDPKEGERWYEAEVDLSSYSGRSVRLVFETDAPSLIDPLMGIPVWSNPAVWAPPEGGLPPNVVLISIDTLRADHMSLYGYRRQTSPRIDRWARRRGVVFETAVASAPWTLPSHVSLFTGFNALRHGVNYDSPAPITLETLAEILRKNGYNTAAFTGGSYLHPRFGLAQGFDEYRSYKGVNADELEIHLKQAIGWLGTNAGRRPFFLFFHTYEVHDPYRPREPYFSHFAGRPFSSAYTDAVTREITEARSDRIRGTHFVLRTTDAGKEIPVPWDEVEEVVNLYDSGIAYADALIGTLLDRLAAPDLFGDTLVVLTSDHGEAFGEHRLAGHTSLYDHDLLVPLVIALPDGQRAGSRVEAQVRLVDVVPTILELTGVAAKPEIDGESLVRQMSGVETEGSKFAVSYAALSNHGLSVRSEEGFKYIMRNLPWRVPAGYEELYDLEADPEEARNISHVAPETDDLRTIARTILARHEIGLRIELANRSPRACRVSLRGSGIRVAGNAVKTLTPGVDCWMTGMGSVACNLGKGDRITLVAERVEERQLEVSGTIAVDGLGSEVPFAITFEVQQNGAPRSVVFDVDGNRMVDGPAIDGTVSVTLSWLGEANVPGVSPAETDEGLRRQLEALGYIQ